MGKIILTLIRTIGLLLPVMAQAQGTLYLSNIGQPSASGDAVGSDSWFAQLFITGANPSGYDLDSVELLMNQASGNPSGFAVALYSNDLPTDGVSLGNLSGSLNPVTTGIYTYSASGITLSPSSIYYIVLTAATPVAQGAYSLSFMDTSSVYSSIDGWSGAGIAKGSIDGLNWQRYGGIFQYAVEATAVPEPAMLALAGLGLVALSFGRRKS
jgi:hypothetical protein